MGVGRRGNRLLAGATAVTLLVVGCSSASEDAENAGRGLVETIDRGSSAEADLSLRSLLQAQDQHFAEHGAFTGNPDALASYGYRVPGPTKGIDLSLCSTGSTFAARADVKGGADQVLDRIYVDSVSRTVGPDAPVGACTPS